MVIYVDLDKENYVTGHGTDDGDVKIDIDKEHEFFKTDIHAWKFIDGKLTFDKKRDSEIKKEQEREQNKPSKEDMNALAILELAEQIESLKGEK